MAALARPTASQATRQSRRRVAKMLARKRAERQFGRDARTVVVCAGSQSGSGECADTSIGGSAFKGSSAANVPAPSPHRAATLPFAADVGSSGAPVIDEPHGV